MSGEKEPRIFEQLTIYNSRLFACSHRPLQARSLALSLEFAHANLTPLVTCASLVSRSVTVDGQRSARETPTVKGKLFVGQVGALKDSAGRASRFPSGVVNCAIIYAP